jgi:trk system potassium uptake protein TrkA
VGEKARAAGKRVAEVDMPQGSLIISVLRAGGGFVPTADTVIEPGDEVLVVLDPGLEDQITQEFASNGDSAGS